MKKLIPTIVIAIFAVFLLTACGGGEEKKPVTLEELASEQGIAVGEFQKTYKLSLGEFYIEDQNSIYRKAELTIYGRTFTDFVLLKTKAGFYDMQTFLYSAKFVFYDAYGKKVDDDISTFIWNDGDYVNIILDGDKPMDGVKYLSIGGLSDENANTSTLYEITDEQTAEANKDEITIFAEKLGMGVGELQVIHGILPKGVFAVDEISKHAELTANGKKFSNAVVIRALKGDDVKEFLELYARFAFYDAKGNANNLITVYNWTDGDYMEIILTSEKPIDDVKYLSIGGFSDHSSYPSFLFELK